MYNVPKANYNKSSEIRVALTVTYYLFNGIQGQATQVVLGVASYANIEEILLPDTSNGNTTITYYFNGHVTHRWVVKSVHLNGNDVEVSLAPRDTSDEIFLQQTMKRVKMSAMQLLRFGTIVEVDFGFKPKIYKGTNQQTSAKRYPDAIQNFELHKRRPAIVLKATHRGVQVVPLTSQKPIGNTTDGSIFELSDESLKLCSQLNKGSYVLSHLIQTVGYSRILPPLSTYNSYKSQRLDTYKVRICKNDERLLATALAHNVGLGDYYTIKKAMNDSKKVVAVLTDDNEKLTTTLSQLESDNGGLKQDFVKIQRERATLRELLKDQYIRAKIYTESEVDAKIDHELAEFAEVTET